MATGSAVVLALGVVSILGFSLLALAVVQLAQRVVEKTKLRRFRVTAKLSKLSIDIEVDAQDKPDELP